MKTLALSVLSYHLAVCRLTPGETLPDWLFTLPFWSVTRTEAEISVVLPEEYLLPTWKAEKGWRGLMVQGPLDFSLTGILAALSSPLAAAGIPIFALSTYDTDYLLIKNQDFSRALEVLSAGGYKIE